MATTTGGPQHTSLAVNTAWNGVDLAVGTLAAIVNSVVVARALGPTILGRYQFILWAAGLVAVVTMYGLPATANRYIARYLAKDRPELAGTVVALTLRFQWLFGLAALGAGSLFALTRAADERLVVMLVFASLVPSLMQAVPTGVNSIDERFGRNVIPSVVSEILGSAGVLTVALAGGGLVELAAVTLGCRCLDAGLRFSLAGSRLRELLAARAPDLPTEDKHEFRQMIWQSVLTQLLTFVVWNRSEIFFLEILTAPAQLAFFSVSFGLASRLRLVPNAVLRAQTPRVLKEHALSPARARALVIRAMRQQMLLAVPLYMTALAFAGDAVAVLYGSEYLPAIPVMQVMVALSLFGAVVLPIEALLTALDGRRTILRLTGISAAITLALDFGLISWLGAIGAGLANGGVALVQALLLGLYAHRRAGLRFTGLRPFPVVFLGILAAAAARGVTWSAAPIVALVGGGACALILYAVGVWFGPMLDPAERQAVGRVLLRGRNVLLGRGAA